VKFSPQQPIDEYPSRFLLDAQAAYAFGAHRQYELQAAGDNLTAQKYAARSRPARVSGSYYWRPNDGQAQFSLRVRQTFSRTGPRCPIKPHPTDRSPIQDSGCARISVRDAVFDHFCAAYNRTPTL